MSNKIYVTRVPFGHGSIVSENTSFLGRIVDDFPEDVMKKIQKAHDDYWTVQGWLDFVYEQAGRRDYKIEVPDQIKEILCLEEEKAKPAPKPRKKATAAASKKKSPTRRKKKGSTSSTSPKTAS